MEKEEKCIKKLLTDSSIVLQSVHVYIKELNDRLEVIKNNQNEIVEQSSSFLENKSLGELKVSFQNPNPPVLDHAARSINFKDLVAKFEKSPELKTNLNDSTHQNFNELQKLNGILKDKITKLKEKFEGNFDQIDENFSENYQYHSLYELTNTNLKHVESLQKELQDAKVIFEKPSQVTSSCSVETESV